jgi:mono/diheme cytochrome c family protein
MRKILFALAFCFAISNLHAQSKQGPKAKAAAGGMAAALANGKAVYTKTCLACHQADGRGVQRMNPPLIKTDYVLGEKNRLINIVLKGFSEDVEINGEYYSNTMPAHDFLKDQEIADVLTYVRNSFGNKASIVSLAEVQKQRSAKK